VSISESSTILRRDIYGVPFIMSTIISKPSFERMILHCWSIKTKVESATMVYGSYVNVLMNRVRLVQRLA